MPGTEKNELLTLWLAFPTITNVSAISQLCQYTATGRGSDDRSRSQATAHKGEGGEPGNEASDDRFNCSIFKLANWVMVAIKGN